MIHVLILLKQEIFVVLDPNKFCKVVIIKTKIKHKYLLSNLYLFTFSILCLCA